MESRPSSVQCCIDRCLTKTKSIKVKDIIYYLFPTDVDWAHKWEKKIKDFDPSYRRKKDDIVCSLHFAKTSMIPVSRQLVDHALPINFPPKLVEPQPVNVSTQKLPVLKVPPEDKCCIIGCTTKFDKDSQIHGYKFPNDAGKRRNWLTIIELYNNQEVEWQPKLKICALHFTDACFAKPNELCDGAKPSIFKDGTVRRKIEIAKQQANKLPVNVTGKSYQPTTMVSVNVPLHQTNAEKHSMTRRSVPIVSRRTSPQFTNMPKLIPKPDAQKRLSVTQDGAGGKVQRLSLPTVTAAAAPTPKATIILKNAARPVPALTKVSTMPNASNSNTNIIVTEKAAAQRKSMPPPLISKNNQPVTVLSHKVIPNKTIHLKRLPPTLKPAPKLKLVAKTTTIANAPKPTQIPIITKVQSIKKAPGATDITPIIAKPVITDTESNTPANGETSEDVIVIEDEEGEIVKAMDESKTGANGATSEIYSVKNESAYDFPSTLLKNILANRHRNEQLEMEANRLRKHVYKLNNQYRLENATSSTETIEIS